VTEQAEGHSRRKIRHWLIGECNAMRNWGSVVIEQGGDFSQEIWWLGQKARNRSWVMQIPGLALPCVRIGKAKSASIGHINRIQLMPLRGHKFGDPNDGSRH
jgi:hypothetical protein